jgi:hypothetical protein
MFFDNDGSVNQQHIVPVHNSFILSLETPDRISVTNISTHNHKKMAKLPPAEEMNLCATREAFSLIYLPEFLPLNTQINVCSVN